LVLLGEVEQLREDRQKSVVGRDAAWSGVSGQMSPERCDRLLRRVRGKPTRGAALPRIVLREP